MPYAIGDANRVLQAIARHYDPAPGRARTIRGLTGDERPPYQSPTGQELDTRAVLARLARGPGKPVADVVTALLTYAVETGAERLQIDAGAMSCVYDGVAREVMDLPAVHASSVIARMRAALRLEAALNRPVSGRTDLVLGDRTLRVKVSASPGPLGGMVTIDLADPVAAPRADLGFSRKVEQTWADLVAAPGLVLLIGPVGSGLRGAAAGVGGAFYMPLKDAASVEAAVKAVEQGRTVLGRVVAPTIPEGLALLREMGARPYGLAEAFTGALSLRRMRRVCQACQLPGDPAGELADKLGVIPFSAPKAGCGCPACGYRGFAGSVHAAELVLATEALRDAVETNAPLRELGSLCRPVADRALQVDAAARAIAGETTISELERVIPARPAYAVRPAAERHRGLLRAMTMPPEDEMADAAEPTTPTPVVHIGSRGMTERFALAPSLASRCELRILHACPPAQGRTDASIYALADSVLGAWDSCEVAELQKSGAKVVLYAEGGGLARMAEAFELGADDYAGSLDELALRIGRWLPPKAAAAK